MRRHGFLNKALVIAAFAVVIAAASAAQAQTWNVNGGTLFANPSSTKVGVGNPNATAQLDVAANTSGRVAMKVNQLMTTANIAEFSRNGTIKVSINNAGVLQADSGVKIKSWSMEVPDYVFDPARYKVSGLDEVERFIKQSGHLPEMPAAAELKQNGMDLAEMNLRLLKKVEELTLYAIEQDKRIKALSRRVARADRPKTAASRVVETPAATR